MRNDIEIPCLLPPCLGLCVYTCLCERWGPRERLTPCNHSWMCDLSDLPENRLRAWCACVEESTCWLVVIVRCLNNKGRNQALKRIKRLWRVWRRGWRNRLWFYGSANQVQVHIHVCHESYTFMSTWTRCDDILRYSLEKWEMSEVTMTFDLWSPKSTLVKRELLVREDACASSRYSCDIFSSS